MKRGEPQRRRSRGRKPEDAAESPTPVNEQTASQPSVAEAVKSEVPVVEARHVVDRSATEAAEAPVTEAPASEGAVTVAEVAAPEASPALATVSETTPPPAEEVVAEAPQPEVPAEPVAAPAGITAEGRAVNDPRVAAKPVSEVAITTNHPKLFKDTVAPAVVPSGRIAPRASNDPRGPLPEAPIAEAAQG
jgi:ribonuclease E